MLRVVYGHLLLSVKHIPPGNRERAALCNSVIFYGSVQLTVQSTAVQERATVSYTHCTPLLDVATCGGISSSLLVNQGSTRYRPSSKAMSQCRRGLDLCSTSRIDLLLFTMINILLIETSKALQDHLSEALQQMTALLKPNYVFLIHMFLIPKETELM